MSHRFWDGWLITVTAGIIAFSVSLVALPQLSQTLFDNLFARQLATHQPLEPSAADYVRFVYGVLGAVMIGWMVSLLFLIAGPFRERTRFGWCAVTFSVLVWFVIDSSFSIWVGFWENAAFNTGFLFLFAPPIIATGRSCLAEGTA